MDSGKLRFYRKCKTVYSLEKYLELDDFDLRSAISKIRVSAHPLEIERGRYKKLPVCERTCKFCTLDTVEDEIHFMTSCISNTIERKELFEDASLIYPHFSNLTDEKKTILLLNSKNPQIIKKVGQFIFHCLRRRSQIQQT